MHLGGAEKVLDLRDVSCPGSYVRALAALEEEVRAQ